MRTGWGSCARGPWPQPKLSLFLPPHNPSGPWETMGGQHLLPCSPSPTCGSFGEGGGLWNRTPTTAGEDLSGSDPSRGQCGNVKKLRKTQSH